jgi:hypothetical protein
MLIAQQKLQENIAEYILYMYQLEDVVRAFQFDTDRLMDQFVLPQLKNPSFETQYREWYGALVKKMINQRLEKSGHLAELNDILVELSYLHNMLINAANDEKYKQLFTTALPFIEEFKERSNLKDKNEIEVMFHAMYMKMLLKLRKKEISNETEQAFDSMRILLAYLSKRYHEMKNGTLNFWNN